MPDTEDFHRNEVLAYLCGDKLFSSEQQIEINELKIFKGWDIDFTYNNMKFQWNTDNKIHILDDKNEESFDTNDKDAENLKEEIGKWLKNRSNAV